VGFAWTAISKESEMSRRFLATLAASALTPGFVCAASARPHSVDAAQKLTGESSMNDATGQ
jgi:hypothetical protein